MKYFEIPDFHFQNNEISDMLMQSVVDAVKIHEPDFVAFVGDFYDGPIMASDKGGINKARKFIKDISRVCHVVAIYGTPSHEPPGSLDIFEDCGMTVLRPGKVYGYEKDVGIFDQKYFDEYSPSAIIFGIPELNKKSLEFLPAQEGNAKIEDAFRVYVREFIAPIRLKHANIPAFGFLHGNVSGSKRENCTDLVLKSASILIHTDDLEPANLTRWSLGHIHKPWESDKICAGYAGSWGTSWGETDFIPAFNMVDDGKITRIPYGTPKRVKITAPLPSYDPTIAYWLDTDDINAAEPSGHLWSRKTCKIQKTETKRTDGDTREMSLSDLFRAIDPEVSPSVLAKVQALESQVIKSVFGAIDASVDQVEITGCTFFNGQDISFDISSLEKRISLLFGDNGAGKSSLLAFCSPYPVVIGKDTKSGRTSAIKDFFPEGGTIKKTLTVNGQKHEHFLTVGKYKTECFLSIDGTPQLDKGTFDELFTMCEKLYGSFDDYILTTFYVQPLQGKSGTSLMSAGMTEIRNLVQNIAGIDRTKEKDFCLERVNELQDKISKIENWLSAAQEFKVDIEIELAKKQGAEAALSEINKLRQTTEQEGIRASAELNSLEKVQTLNNAEKKRKIDNENQSEKIRAEIILSELKITSLSEAVSNLEKNRALLSTIEENDKKYQQYSVELSAWKSKKQAHEMNNESQMLKYRNEKTKIEAQIREIENTKTRLENENALLNKPCFKCGAIDPKNQAIIDANNIRLNEIPDKIIDLNFSIPKLPVSLLFLDPQPEEPELGKIPETNVTVLKSQIESAISAEQVTEEINETIKKNRSELEKLSAMTYEIDEEINNKVEVKRNEVEKLRTEYQVISKQATQEETEIKQIDANIKKANEEKENISIKERELAVLSGDLTDYSYMAKMLQPAKIPALELDFFIASIDLEASRILELFDDGRYSVSTETQQVGKKDIIDKFDIKIHDNETGIDKSFLEWNPGHKAFFNDAYVKALIKQRNEKMKRNYNPIVLDEADGPIQPERIKEFYNIQRNEYINNKVLVVSHSPTCHEHIENIINIKELKR